MHATAAEISLTTSPQRRLRILNEIAEEGRPYAQVWAMNVLARQGVPPSSARHVAQAILRAVQYDLLYKDDPPGKEVFTSVAETILAGGDCEDLSVVLVSALRALGIRARVVWITQEGRSLNHVTAQVSFSDPSVPDNLAEWLWAEPSIRGAELGENPYAAAARLRDFQAIGQQGIPDRYEVVLPAGSVITRPAGSLSQSQIDEIVQGIRAAANNDGQQRLEGGLNGAVIGAARAAGAQLAGGMAIAIPKATQNLANVLPETAREAATAAGQSLLPVVQQLGLELQTAGPRVAGEFGTTLGRELGREIAVGSPAIGNAIRDGVVAAAGRVGEGAERIAVATNQAVLAGAILLGGTIFASVTLGVIAGVSISKVKSRRSVKNG